MTTKTDDNKVSIQERVAQRVGQISQPIEQWLDSIVAKPEKFNPENYKLIEYLKKEKTKGQHARKLKELYQGQYDEIFFYLKAKKKPFEELNDDDQQLVESYNEFSKEELQLHIKTYEHIFKACDYMIDIANANRKSRKRKPVNKTKAISKLKYKREDDRLKLISINPEEIIGCEELWVYNTKTRKLGYYVTSVFDPQGQEREGTGLGVKGTSVIRFNQEASVQKTLRKPPEQLPHFIKGPKTKLKEDLDDIKAMGLKLNGRINPDVILLRAIR